MAHLQTALISHTQRVCRLYKRALRNIDSYSMHRDLYRYRQSFMRLRFEENRHIIDMRVAKQLVTDGEEELFLTMHPQPKKFAYSPGGSCYERVVNPPDDVLDWWHPLEKAVYPDYFARREQRKKEYIEYYEKKYGKLPEMEH